MAKKSIVRKSRNSKRTRKSVSKRSRKMTSGKSKRSKRTTSRKIRSKKSKRVSYRMMPSAAGGQGRDIHIPVYDEVGNQTQYTIRKRDYTEMAEPYGLRYLRITPNGRPHFFDRYEDAARATFVPSALGRTDHRVWIIQNDGTAFFVANE